MGKGTTGLRSLQREHDADTKDCYRHANLTAGNSEQGETGQETLVRRASAKRATLKSPVRENRTPGSVRGAPGNRRPYLDTVSIIGVVKTPEIEPVSS